MKIVFSPQAEKQFLKLDKPLQRQIQKYVLELQKLSNPRTRGKALVGNMAHLWRYRVGDYRLICDIQDEKILITVLRLGHRKIIYNL